MDNPWIIWPALVAFWVLIIAGSFAYFEKHFWNRLTLSRFTFEVTKRFPLLIFFIGLSAGLVLGILATHFWWHWCPDPSISIG